MECIETDKGRVHIITGVSLRELTNFKYTPCFSNSNGYRPFYTELSAFERQVEQGAHLTIAVTDNRTIVGFAVIDRSDEKKYWGRPGKDKVLELTTVEVLREYREKTIAGRLLKTLFSTGEFENLIICLAGYVWTWDLEGSGLSAREYRAMLMRFYAGFGFKPYQTSEPNINLKPENFLLARFGKNINPKEIDAFQLARYGLSMESSFAN